MYFGPAASAASYFEAHLHYPLPPNTNPADYFLDVLETDQSTLSRNFSSETNLSYSQHSEYDFEAPILGFSLTAEGQEMLDEIMKIRETKPPEFEGTRAPATRLQRTYTLILRTFKAKARAGKEFFVAPIVCCVLALLCGELFGEIPVWDPDETDWMGNPIPYWSGFTKRMSVILFSIIMFCLQSLPQLGKQVQERASFQRDRAGGLYSALEYFTAISLTDTPLHIVMVTVFSLIIYHTVHLLGSFWFFMLGMYVVLLFGYSAAHLIILFSADAISALSACMALIAYSFLLNGQVINREDMGGVEWMFNTSFIYNALEMITISEMESEEMIEAWGPVNSTDNPLQSAYGFAPQDKWICFRNLILATIFLRAGIFAVLHYKYVEMR